MDEFEFPKEEHIDDLQKTVNEFFTENNLEMMMPWFMPSFKGSGYGDGDMSMFYMLQGFKPLMRYKQIGVCEKLYLAIVFCMSKFKQD